MIVDPIVLLSISRASSTSTRFAGALLGRGNTASDCFELACDVAQLGAEAIEKLDLAQLVRPDTELLGYVFVNHGMNPADITNGLHTENKRVLLFQLAAKHNETAECRVFENTQQGWVEEPVEVHGNQATEIALETVLGGDIDRQRAKEILLQKIREIREDLDNPHADRGKRVIQAAQLWKMKDVLASEDVESDSVVYEMLAQVVALER